jgi:hypothetical protein
MHLYLSNTMKLQTISAALKELIIKIGNIKRYLINYGLFFTSTGRNGNEGIQ